GLGLTEDGAVDHAAVQLEDALVAPGRVQDTAGPGDLVVVGRVRLSDGGHLGRVDTGGGHESERDGVERLGALTRLVGDVEVHRVHRPPAERRGGEGDPGAGAPAAPVVEYRSVTWAADSVLASVTQRYPVAASASRSAAWSALSAGLTRTIVRAGSSSEARSASRATVRFSGATASSRSTIT